MDDLIKRQDAIDAVNYHCESLKDIKRAIMALPSAHTERKKGEWIKPTGMMPPEHHGHYECSECGAWAMRPWLRPWKGVVLTDFCPDCGAVMRKGRVE